MINALFLLAQEAEPRSCRTLAGREQTVSLLLINAGVEHVAWVCE